MKTVARSTAPTTGRAPGPDAGGGSRQAPPARRPGRLAYLLVIVGVPLLVLGLAEGAARLLEPRDDLVEKEGVGRVPRWLLKDPALAATFEHMDMIRPDLDLGAILDFWKFYQRDANLHYRLRPNMRMQTLNTMLPRAAAEKLRWTLNSNEDGFRGPRLPSTPPPDGVTRVVCIGDSSTYGWGVEEDEAFPARLPAALAARGTAKAEVYNLGHPGYTSWQGRLLLDRIGRARPQAVVISYGPNDQSKAGVSDRALHGRDATILAGVSRTVEHLALYRAMNRALLSVWTPTGGTASKDLVVRVPLGEYRDNLAEIVRRVQAWGGTPILLAISNHREYGAMMRRVAGESNTRYRDADAIYEAALPEVRTRPAEFAKTLARIEDGVGPLESSPQFFVKIDATHPNPVGHELIARALAGLM